MKKKVLGIIAVVAIAAVAGYNVYTSQNNSNLSDLALANMEALASGSESGAKPCGGPKENSECQSRNETNCKDLFGCQ